MMVCKGFIVELMIGDEQSLEFDAVLLAKVLGNGDVAGPGLLFGDLSLESIPGIPLGLALEVQHAGSIGVDVSDLTLLEVSIERKLLVLSHVLELGVFSVGTHEFCSSMEVGL